MTTNNLLLDANVKHQISVIQVSQSAANEFLPILKKARDEINKQLLKVGSIATKKELNELNRLIENKLLKIYGQYPKLLEKENRKFISNEYKFQKNILSEAVAETAGKSAVTLPNIDKAITSILNTPMQVASKGGSVYLNTLLNSFAKKEAKRTRDRITAGYFNNETVSEIARSISGTRINSYKDGLLNITNSNARTMAKTGVTHLQTQASHTVFKENEDIIKGYEIVATLDSKTSGKCRSLDGQIFDLGNGPKPPFHPNCRTTTTAVLKDEYNIPSAKADRVSQTGDVSSETTYYSWLKNQPADIQNQALGTERGLIFRNSGLSPEEFRKASVDQFYEPLTIDQMAAKDKRIANYMRN